MNKIKKKLLDLINNSPEMLKNYIFDLENGQSSVDIQRSVFMEEDNKMLKRKLKEEKEEIIKKDFIKKVVKWQETNFGENEVSKNIFGLMEELGELAHAQLKGEQKVRFTSKQFLEMKKDAVGDLVLFLIGYCVAQKFDFNKCLKNSWNVVKRRDYKKIKKIRGNKRK